MKKIFFILFLAFIFSGCSRDLVKKTETPAEEEKRETNNLKNWTSYLKASVIVDEEKENKAKELTYGNGDYGFSLKYPENFVYFERKNDLEKVLKLISFQEKISANENNKLFINLKIINQDFSTYLKNLESTEEIQTKEQIVKQNKKGVKITGVEPGRKIFLMPLKDNKVLSLEINDLNLEEVFEAMIEGISE